MAPKGRAGEKDEAGDRRENECEIVIDDEIRGRGGGSEDGRKDKDIMSASPTVQWKQLSVGPIGEAVRGRSAVFHFGKFGLKGSSM